MEICHTKRNFCPFFDPFWRDPLTKQNKAKTKVDGKKLPKSPLEVIFCVAYFTYSIYSHKEVFIILHWEVLLSKTYSSGISMRTYHPTDRDIGSFWKFSGSFDSSQRSADLWSHSQLPAVHRPDDGGLFRLPRSSLHASLKRDVNPAFFKPSQNLVILTW